MATTDAFVLLREMGLDPSGAGATRAIGRVKARLTFEMLANRPNLDGETEPCIDGATLAVGTYLGTMRRHRRSLLHAARLADGG